MSLKSIDYITMVDNAFYIRRTKTRSEAITLITKLFVDGYWCVKQLTNVEEYRQNLPDTEVAFRAVRSMLLAAAATNGALSDFEYEIYCNFCKQVNKIPLSQSKASEAAKSQLTIDKVKILSSLNSGRHLLNETLYHNLVYAMTLTIIYQDGHFFKSDYDLMTIMLRPGFDKTGSSYNDLMSQIYI